MTVASWMTLTAAAGGPYYPTNNVGGISATAGSSILISNPMAGATQGTAVSRELEVAVYGFSIAVAPAANTTLTLENHDGSVSIVMPVNTGAGIQRMVKLGGDAGIRISKGLRATLAANATVHIYYSAR